MGPLRGRIKTVVGDQMEIELPTGAIVQAHRRPELGVGDPCWITWDYTRSRTHLVMTHDEYVFQEDSVEEPDETFIGNEDALGPEDWPPDEEYDAWWFL